MEQLRKSIVRKFILYSFAIAVIESVIDSIFDDAIFPNIPAHGVQEVITMSAYIIISLLVFLLFGLLYARNISKLIKEEADRQVNDRNLLFANIVHDLKTPITTILGFSQALSNGKVKEIEKADVIHSIYEKARGADDLVNRMFQYTKLSTDEYQMHFECQDVCRILRESVALQYELFEERKIELELDIPEETITCALDNMEFGRALGNLLTNAWKHNVRGSKVFIGIESVESTVRIVIADNGKDISTDQEETIFDPFICADESRNSRNGSGLGLAITKKIIEKHRGLIYITHEIKGYTKGFVVEVPL
jgi:signal transduction histidine kinase